MAGRKYPKYSALMSVYKNEEPECLLASIASVLYQTAPCDEFILVEDGPLTNELYDVINKCDESYPGIIKEVKLEYNLGLGLALNAGINHCSNELIAQFDSDDISTKDRCEKQLAEFMKDPELDIIGTNHIEFIDDITNKESFLYKKLPESDEEIKKYAKKRNPFSHSAVMYRKSAIIKAGNYRDYRYVEDYDLWVRMIKSGAKCKNINEYLSYVKVDKRYPEYSVLMTVYAKEKAEYLKEAIDSMLNQTVKPSEFVLVEDGPLNDELYATIKEYKKNPIFKIVTLEDNQGSGPASAAGVLACSNEWIARLDSDDYSVPNRIEKQFAELKNDQELDVIGANVIEIEGDNPDNQQKVILPENNEEIRKFTGRRCPFRTSAILFKKEIVLKAGNYRTFYRVEDYDVFARIVACGAKCINVQDFLSYMRIDKDYYKRRGGIKLANSIVKLKREIRKNGLSDIRDHIISVPIQVAVCLMPNNARDCFYRKVLRK